jgi:hypothetical protein
MTLHLLGNIFQQATYHTALLNKATEIKNVKIMQFVTKKASFLQKY